jgi:hypothetical protein
MYLARSAERALAAAAITEGTDVDAVLAHVATDILDLTSSAILTAIGVQDGTVARSVLAILWGQR